MELFCIGHEIITSLYNMNDKELCSFMKLYKDPVNNEQIELYIYTCFLVFTRTYTTEFLEQAIQRAAEWITETANDYPDCT